MQIARIRHLFYPYMPRDYFYELSAKQEKRGHSVDVFSWCRNGTCSEEKVAEGFTIHGLHGLNLNLGGLIQEYPYLPELPTKLEILKPDIVHCESHLFLPTVQAVRAAKKFGFPCVVTVHGVTAEKNALVNFGQRFFIRTLGTGIFKAADRIICLTQSDAERIADFGCAFEKIRVIPNAVNAEFFKPCDESEERLVIWTGRFVPEKGLEYLIKAAKILAAKNRNVRFLLIGYGALKTKLMKLAECYGLLDRYVYFRGPYRRKEIQRILGKASVFAFPSLSEGLPISVLEAMSCGKPVICSDLPGLREVVFHKKSGLLIPPKNPLALANAIMLLLENRKYRMELGEKARESIIQKYNWKVVTDKLEQVYNEAIHD